MLIALIGCEAVPGSQLALHKVRLAFSRQQRMGSGQRQFGALPFIFGTLVSSVIALLIAVPISIATAVYLTELAPLWMRQPLTMFIELLAAVPSVILGLVGNFCDGAVAARPSVSVAAKARLGFCRCFRVRFTASSMLAGGIIVAIMIIPIITSVSREILRSVPGLQREAAYALGATRWEVTRIAVLSYAKKGLFGAVDPRPGPRAGRNDGRHDGHRQHAADRRLAFRARLHAGQRHRQRIQRGHRPICIPARCLKSAWCCSA